MSCPTEPTEPTEGASAARSSSADATPGAFVRRACFACGEGEGPVFQDESWTVLGLGRIRKGYRVCAGCGLVLQDPAVPPERMAWHYAHLSNYTNPMADGRPGPRKRRAVEVQLAFLEGRTSGRGRVFQVGSSDGYTLSRFAARGHAVKGCDPSAAAAAVARRLWSVPTRVGPFESYRWSPNERHDLIVLTHVLEHLYDPVECLRHCRRGLAPGGRLLVEVPLLIAPERLPPGYLQLEHVNYFTRTSLRDVLGLAGFEIEGDIEVDLETDQYPVQRLVARRARPRRVRPSPREAEASAELLRAYEERDRAFWRASEARVLARPGPGRPVYVWGAGIHTSILLARTDLRARLEIRGLVDSDPQKWPLDWDGLPVIGPDRLLSERDGASIVISTHAGEPAIARLLERSGVPAEEVVRLYGAEAEGKRSAAGSGPSSSPFVTNEIV